ncbi:MAG: hypothetical protein FWB76_03980 [Oscillospiraceae bacterium]|nr:hypothetical protein [Oscillospiraceae bacterium]
MVRQLDAAKRYTAPALAWYGKQRKWFPLVLAIATLLLGILPMATASWLGMNISVYQLSFSAVLRFVLAPLTIAAIWAFDRFMQDFSRYTKTVLTVAAAVQVVSLCMLLYSASNALTHQITTIYTNAAAIPQSLGVGAWLMLALSAWFLIDCGLQLTRGKAKAPKHTDSSPVSAM